MSEVATPKFACDACGKSYKWSPALSKKRVKCKCGATMTVPDLSVPAPSLAEMLDGPPALPGDDVYDMIDAVPATGAPAAVLAADAALLNPPRPGPVAKPARAGKGAQPLGYRTAPTPQRQRDRIDTLYDIKRDIYLPAGLLIGSFALYLGWVLFQGRGASMGDLIFYAFTMGAIFLVKTVFMVAAAFIVAPLAGVSFGPIWTAILKLGAVSLAPDIFATVLEQMISAPGAWILTNSLALAMYWALMSILFQFDAAEAWVVVVYFGIIRFLLGIVIGMFIVAAVMNGGLNVGGGGGGGGNVPPSVAAAEFDASVVDMKESDLLEDSADTFKRGKQMSMSKHVDAFYDAGAANVWFSNGRDFDGKKEPVSLVIEWPKNAAKRAGMLAALESYRKSSLYIDEDDPSDGAFTDNGGRYIEVDLAIR